MVVAIVAGFILMAPELLHDAGQTERAVMRLRMDYLRLRHAVDIDAEPRRTASILEDLRSSLESVRNNGVLEALRTQDPHVEDLIDRITTRIDALPAGDSLEGDRPGGNPPPAIEERPGEFTATAEDIARLDARVAGLIREQVAALRTGVWAVLALLVGVMVILAWLNIQNRRLLDSLSDALEAKKLQIQETHHRVKNNLALVASLINIKEAAAGANVDLTDLRSRIYAIRTVHDNLARGESAGEVEMSRYVDDLVAALVASLPATRVETDVRVPTLRLPAKQAVAIGIVINEVATNAAKHAFSQDETNRLSVRLEHGDREHGDAEQGDGGQLRLTITNSGPPMPVHVDVDNPASLGLQLVSTLVRQHRGSIRLHREPETTFIVTMPVSQTT